MPPIDVYAAATRWPLPGRMLSVCVVPLFSSSSSLHLFTGLRVTRHTVTLPQHTRTQHSQHCISEFLVFPALVSTKVGSTNFSRVLAYCVLLRTAYVLRTVTFTQTPVQIRRKITFAAPAQNSSVRSARFFPLTMLHDSTAKGKGAGRPIDISP